MYDVIVIGGGVVGLSIARELAGRKASVLLLDRGSTGQGTSRAAAGMLAPLSEADDQGPLFQLTRDSHALYDSFVEDLQSETGLDVVYSKDGLIFLSSSEQSAQVLHRRYEWQKKAGFEIESISADVVYRMEPRITIPVCSALFIPGERSLAPRRFADALRHACLLRGVEIRTGLHVEAVSSNQVRAGQVRFDATHIVIASGVWSGELAGLDPPIPVYPRKGQILSLGMPAGAFRRMIRWESSYFAPRRSGELVVGATNEDAGFDMSNTPAGVGRLLMDAQQISSHVGNYPILEIWAGLRPATPDGLPIIGPSAVPGVYYATGHYRNGVLLAPITATIIADLIAARQPKPAMAPYSPLRFKK
jgi:glycine oxidase